ncbi:serine protein kinase RIO [Candidatus Micrarchaeota archaeon]|nr:serine protein kinase RIO [Candidatus Micrarchaeota archaeon]
MARKVSTRKKPSRDKIVLNERFKIESEVFDKPTLLSLMRIMQKGVINRMEYPISTGKEANVFLATTPSEQSVAVKIYKIETTHFLRRKEYLEGDPRYKKFRGRERDLVFAFAQKEFKNLQICERAGVHAPRPLFLEKNIIVMEFLGREGRAYPVMSTVGPAEGDLESILEDMRKLYRAGLVHADLSEYNIMVWEGPPYIIDWGQSVALGHKRSEEYLERDIYNVLKYFAFFGLYRDPKAILAWIRE